MTYEINNDKQINKLKNNNRLQKCRQITDKGIKALLTKFKGLKILDITRCDSLTDESLETIANHLDDIESLFMVGGCPEISENGKRRLQTACGKKLKIIS